MAIRRSTAEEIEEGQRLVAPILDPDAEKQDAEPTKVMNAEAIQKLLAVSAFGFRGRSWRVGYLSFPDGSQALKFRGEAKRLSKYVASGMMLDEYNDLCARVAKFLWRVVTPGDGWTAWERLKWRMQWMQNPFEKATDGELGDMLDFCLLRRTTSSVTITPSD
jgi:hypothetical protein